MIRRPPRSTLFPTRRSSDLLHPLSVCAAIQPRLEAGGILVSDGGEFGQWCQAALEARHRLINGPAGSDRKSTRLNSSHSQISYAVFCLKKKTIHSTRHDAKQ